MWWICTSFGRSRAGALPCAAAVFLMLIIGASNGLMHPPPDDRIAIAGVDTITVEGPVVSVGSEPFTRLRLIEKGGGGYILQFDETDPIKLRRQGPTKVRVVGVPFVDVWQGREIQHLRVVRWRLLN